MNRRTFAGAAGLAALAAGGGRGAESGKGRRVFLLEQYFLKQGAQPARLHEYLEKGVAPAYGRLGIGPAIFLEAVVTPHMPQIAAVLPFESVDHFASMRAKIAADRELAKAFDAWENGSEQPYEHASMTLLEATDYCPPLKADSEPRKSPRVFELRVYHSPTWRQLRLLHQRFSGPEIKIFHRVGVNPILYSSTLVGQNMPNLTYLIPFDDLAARDKAWAAFGADPEWVKVRKESIDRGGQISISSNISLYRATPYSPIR